VGEAQGYLKRRRARNPSALKNTRVHFGSFSKPKELFPGSVDFIRIMDVLLGFYPKLERIQARALLGQALREGGWLIEGGDDAFVGYQKQGDGRLVPIEFNYRLGSDLDVSPTPHSSLDIRISSFLHNLDAAVDMLPLRPLEREAMHERLISSLRDLGYQGTIHPNGLLTMKLDPQGEPVRTLARDGGDHTEILFGIRPIVEPILKGLRPPVNRAILGSP